MPEQPELRRHVQLRTHQNNPFPVDILSHDLTLNLAISTVPLGVGDFEDVVGVAGNTCIERSRNSIRLHGQTNGRRFFQDPDIRKICSDFRRRPQ